MYSSIRNMILGSLFLFIFISCGGDPSSTGDGNNDTTGCLLLGGVCDPDSDESPSTDSSIPETSLTFDISDAVAIMKVNDSSLARLAITTPASNIVKLTTTGSIEDVIIESETVIQASELFIAPDGKLYLLFSSAVRLNEQPCVLLRLSRDNTADCVDSDLQSVDSFSTPTQPIQFDASGNIFYAGRSSGGERVLRRKSSSLEDSTDLINDNITISRFLVVDDGTVYVSGTTTATNTTFFRRILPTGTLVNLMNGASIQSLYELPDGNIYAGEWGETFGVMKITSEGIEDKLYIGYTSMNGIPYDAEFFVDSNSFDSCNGINRPTYEDFCGFGGTNLSYFHRTPDDEVYVVAGSGDRASLWQYWPSVEPIDTSVLRPTIVSGTLTTLLIAGYDESSNNRLIAFNTSDQSEIDLLEGEDIEIYHFSYSASSGRVIFDGLRFSDNKYIVGSIDTQDGNALTVLESGIRYDDLQFFE